MLIFGAVVVMIARVKAPDAAPPTESAHQLIELLSIVHVALALILYPTAITLYNRAYDPRQLQQQLNEAGSVPEARAQTCLQIMRTAHILRLAPVEGVAMFGLVVCLLGVQSDVLAAFPRYWLNLFSSVILLAMVAANLPGKESLLSEFRRKILTVF
ncbi:MAG: hypothetical protein D6681_04510 [Calditrichaeota bacterium]|nr:MAG: hypothetical protein D6681_04510 [Calditrichota bacterium]